MKEKITKQIKKILENQSSIKNAKHNAKAFAFSLALVLGVVFIADGLYQEKTPLKRGYKVQIVKNAPTQPEKDVGGVAVGSLPDLKGASTEAVGTNIEDMIKLADIDKGEKIFKKCAACHSIEKGAPNKIGPNLHTVIGRKKASWPDFKYSDGMKNKGGSWDIASINQFITKPKDFVTGTKMSFAGLPKDKDRANVIAYLISESKK